MAKPLKNEVDTETDRLWTLGDHPALDLLNTVTPLNGKMIDSLKIGNDVLEWMDRAGWSLIKGSKPSLPPGLVKTTRALREELRTLIEKRKAGKRLNLETLNAFLAGAGSHLFVAPGPHGSLDLRRRWKQRTAEQVLGPLIEAAAELLVEGDFSLIRRCENKNCVLWFYDRTRSHHRRWCSMATCGNRSKIEAFRARQRHRSLTGKVGKTSRKKPAK